MRAVRTMGGGVKRGQGEILGLAVVVVLVIVGFSIALVFIINDSGEDTRDVVVDQQTASAMLTAMLHTNIECKDITLSEVLQDCANPLSTFEYCGSPHRSACEEAEYVTGEMLEDSLGEWGRSYGFIVYSGSDPGTGHIFNHTVNECGVRFGTEQSKIFPLPTRSGTLRLKLTICAS